MAAEAEAAREARAKVSDCLTASAGRPIHRRARSLGLARSRDDNLAPVEDNWCTGGNPIPK